MEYQSLILLLYVLTWSAGLTKFVLYFSASRTATETTKARCVFFSRMYVSIYKCINVYTYVFVRWIDIASSSKSGRVRAWLIASARQHAIISICTSVLYYEQSIYIYEYMWYVFLIKRARRRSRCTCTEFVGFACTKHTYTHRWVAVVHIHWMSNTWSLCTHGVRWLIWVKTIVRSLLVDGGYAVIIARFLCVIK